LGTGGASKAVKFALEKLGVSTCLVSRNKKENHWIYSELNADILKKNLIIINTTPLGTSPNINESPKIPFEYITPEHLVFDLIYNPAETLLMKKAKFQGAQTLNGYEMLCLQAEAGWKIWSKQPETTE
jgi:shikimate dehydrogenase